LDIVNRLVERVEMPRQTITKAVNAVCEILKEGLADGERIELRGFGTFQVKARKTGVGRNPKTGQVAEIPPGKTVKFRAGKDMNSVFSG
jgi:DNA-binding protein HU-beta